MVGCFARLVVTACSEGVTLGKGGPFWAAPRGAVAEAAFPTGRTD